MLSVRDLVVRRDGATLLAGVDLVVGPGELVVVVGSTGSGKSTLLRAAAGLWATSAGGGPEIPGQLEIRGEVRVAETDPGALPPAERARRVAWVGQVPSDQLVGSTVLGDATFGPLGWRPDIAELSAEALVQLGRLGLGGLVHSDPQTLSGGRQQRLLIAGALTSGARLVLLDEPLAWLDPQGARAVVAALRRLADEGVAVVVAEHRTAELGAVADRVVHLSGASPLSPSPSPRPASAPGATLRSVAGALRWPGSSAPALTVEGLSVGEGERVALIGPNGSGKSTLLAALAGRLPGATGPARVVEVPQEPDLTLFSASVADELALGLVERGLPPDEIAARVADLCERFGMSGLGARVPQSLSRGQRWRLAVASALAADPTLLLLDEPTAGQDPEAAGPLLEQALSGPHATVFATHDLALAERFADRLVVIDQGRIVADGPVAETLAAARAVHGRDEAPVGDGLEARPGAGLDPRVRILAVLALGIAVLCVDRAASLAVLTALAGLPLVLRPQELARSGRWLALAILVWSTMFSQGLFYAEPDRTALLHLGPVAVWREGLIHGLAQSLRFVSVALAGWSLVATTAPERILSGLRGLGVPWVGGFLATQGLRALPDLAADLATVRRARASRGRAVWARSPWAWLALELALVRPVVARALRRADRQALALTARGFSPARSRYERPQERLRAVDLATLAVITPALTLLVGLRALFAVYVADLWWNPAWASLYALARAL